MPKYVYEKLVSVMLYHTGREGRIVAAISAADLIITQFTEENIGICLYNVSAYGTLCGFLHEILILRH